MRTIIALIWTLLCITAPGRALAAPEPTFQQAMDDYVQRADFQIRQNIDWRFVRGPVDAEALVVIRFDPNGKFVTAKVEERSANPAFDVALESAIRRSIPMLPPPPIPPGVSGPFAIPMRFHALR